MGAAKTVIKMWPGKDYMTVDGKEIKLEQPPVIDKSTDRTLVPVRAPFEAAGFNVDWDESTKTITIEG